MGYTGWPSSMPTTRDTNRSFGDRWSGAFFESGSPISPVLPGRDGEVGYYFLQITITTPIMVVLPCRRVAPIPSRSLACNAFPFVDYWPVNGEPGCETLQRYLFHLRPSTTLFERPRALLLTPPDWKCLFPFVAFPLVLEFFHGKHGKLKFFVFYGC